MHSLLAAALLGAAPIVKAPAPPEAQLPIAIDTPAQVASLCQSLDSAERAGRRGEAVDRGVATARQEAVRRAALARRYRVLIPSRFLDLDVYDPEEEQLSLSGKAVLTAAQGTLRVWSTSEPDLPVEVPEQAARRIARAQRAGTLALALTFTLPGDEDSAPCAHVAGGRSYVVAVEPVAWEYLEGHELLARGGEEADKPLLSAAQGARPRVEVAEATGEGARPQVRERVLAHLRELDRCYGAALSRNPRLDGTVVAELDLRPAGNPAGVKLVADSLQDEGLGACVTGVLVKTRFAAAKRETVMLPIHFVLEAPAGR